MMIKSEDNCEVIDLGNDVVIVKGTNEVPRDKIPLNKEIADQKLTRIEKQLNLGWNIDGDVKIEDLAFKIAKLVKMSNLNKNPRNV